mgnify:FL=1
MFATNKTSNMTKRHFSLPALAVVAMTVALSGVAIAQDSDAPIEERMSTAERQATGINKLTADELAALNAWLSRQQAEVVEREVAEATQAIEAQQQEEAQDRRGLRERIAGVFTGDDNDSDTITSRLVGTFDGWDGETVFELENGMVWRQAETNLYTVRATTNPEVVIRRGLFDRWRLQVKGYNKRLTVERVK